MVIPTLLPPSRPFGEDFNALGASEGWFEVLERATLQANQLWEVTVRES
ncbi:hypothetical protein E2C01_100806 [Portunus trituberculatus]|uniref:Uncharacterized protein n=1 Tax=Portunus trituberculatus TaxID=210409 RepID=A0A5B7K7V7_PORTR|nr:hypothetical protein [Portunus trituberculatus]